MICWHFQPRILRALHFMKKDVVILGEDLEKLLGKLPYTPTSRHSLFLPFHPTSTVLFRCCATSTAVFLIHCPVKIYISHLLFFLTSSTFHNPESSSWLDTHSPSLLQSFLHSPKIIPTDQLSFSDRMSPNCWLNKIDSEKVT